MWVEVACGSICWVIKVIGVIRVIRVIRIKRDTGVIKSGVY